VRHSSGRNHQMTICFCSAALLLERKARLLLAAAAPGPIALSLSLSLAAASFSCCNRNYNRNAMVAGWWLAFFMPRKSHAVSGFVGIEIMKKTVGRKVKKVEILSDLSCLPKTKASRFCDPLSACYRVLLLIVSCDATRFSLRPTHAAPLPYSSFLATGEEGDTSSCLWKDRT